MNTTIKLTDAQRLVLLIAIKHPDGLVHATDDVANVLLKHGFIQRHGFTQATGIWYRITYAGRAEATKGKS